MMRKLYGFFNKTFSLLITTCFENTWPVGISMPPPIKKIWVETTLFVYFVVFFFGRGGGAGGGEVVWRPSIFFLAVVELDGLDLFSNLRLALNLGLPVASLQSRFNTSRVDTSCKKFHVLGLKNEEYSPKM